MVRRFVEEAQIGGQLQHPGIVPIYELGAFADRRPFFSMKLVKGHTLAGLLADRDQPSDGLPRFLAIFESIAQTVAYAHARGVIHRDLKPSNVMVGNFGEVQVMDWGLAKVLPRGGVVDDATAGRDVTPVEETVIATARSGSDADSDLSRAGSVLGTPSYMAPEQARGEVAAVDERADVFALGSILCEILTGRPAFSGRTSGDIQRRAARGDLADALAPAGRLRGRRRPGRAWPAIAWPPSPTTVPGTPGRSPGGWRRTWRACRSGCTPPSWPTPPRSPAPRRPSAPPRPPRPGPGPKGAPAG